MPWLPSISFHQAAALIINFSKHVSFFFSGLELFGFLLNKCAFVENGNFAPYQDHLSW